MSDRSSDALAKRLRKARIAQLMAACNKARIDISMHKLQTYGGVMEALGIADRAGPWLDRPSAQAITVTEFNVVFATPLMEQLAAAFQKEIANGHAQNAGPVSPAHTDTDADTNKERQESQPAGPSATVGDTRHEEQQDSDSDIHPIDLSGWGYLDDLPGRNCTLFRHQIKASKDMLHKLYVKNNRADLLNASVGVGKTFMFFEVISQLWAKQWFKGKSFSPWPVCIVTKASIVEQTKRVGVERFGLDPFRQFKVINYDGLRSSAGASMIKDTTIVEDGVARKLWDWHPGVHPMLFILDECQSAKNEDSQQSQICQAIARIADPNVRVICSSATAFTRVCESKYFVLNCHLTYSVI